MRAAHLAVAACVLLVRGGKVPPLTVASDSGTSGTTIPLILEQNEGEHRVWRPIEGAAGWDTTSGPFILKIDPQNGGSTHMVFGTEDLPPGATIDRHNHPGADEIIFLQNGTAHVSLGAQARDVHGGATVFIPAHTWISVTNTGKDPIHMAFAFSAPGFESYMRAESVPEGQPAPRLSTAEDAAIQKRYEHAVVYQKP